MIHLVTLVLVMTILSSSLYTFSRYYQDVRGSFSRELFSAFIAMYVILMLGFALIYFSLAEIGYTLLQGELLQVGSVIERFFHAIYFSGVTLMTIGYGDITPVGIGRVIALVEAFIGFLLPAAFFYKLFR
ncbi:potassium channel family protein [Alkalibacillus salilacus]|uniref:Potassium channel LctB n=1 Tax=Alkalibacillus salilacus TaxID=284582 RepID=A0ABT9VFV7_9BACI|nr:potassium channel family protein [Alkalibacillus salilacus]MDQ0159839.1 potassium channel LctB [Alkalibacillus salilacus]